MTLFQAHCKKNPSMLLQDTYETFRRYYPNVPEVELKARFKKEVNELFFRRLPR